MGREYLTVKISSDLRGLHKLEEKVVLKKVISDTVEKSFKRNFLKIFGIMLGVGVLHLPLLGSLTGFFDMNYFTVNGFYWG